MIWRMKCAWAVRALQAAANRRPGQAARLDAGADPCLYSRAGACSIRDDEGLAARPLDVEVVEADIAALIEGVFGVVLIAGVFAGLFVLEVVGGEDLETAFSFGSFFDVVAQFVHFSFAKPLTSS